MNTTQALNILYSLSKLAPLPKGLDGNEAINYLNQIEDARKTILSVIKPIEKDND